jgi:hypothetical protein
MSIILSEHLPSVSSEALIKVKSKLTKFALSSRANGSALVERPEHIQRILDLPDEEIDKRVSLLVSEAETAEQLTGEVPDQLIEDIREQAHELVDTLEIKDYGQLAVVAIADAYHFTQDQEIIDTALTAVNENPDFDNKTAQPVVNAVHRVAETGMSMVESMKIELSAQPHLPSLSSNESPEPVKQVPIAGEYDFLFHPTIRRPNTPEYTHAGIHPSLKRK